MPGSVRVVSPICPNPAQTGINSVWKTEYSMYSKNSFPGSSNESNPGRDWPHACTSPCMYLTPLSFPYFGSQTGWETQDYQPSLESGLKSYWYQLSSLKDSGSVQFNIEMQLLLPPPALKRWTEAPVFICSWVLSVFNGCVTWDSWRRLLVWRGLSIQERGKHNFSCFEKPWSW